MHILSGSLALAILAAGLPADSYAQSNVADAAMARGDAVAAISAWTQTLQFEPANVRALVGRANAFAWDERYAQALQDVDRAIELAPDNLEANTTKGWILAWAGEPDAAKPWFERALAISPDNVSARKGRAYADLWSDDFDAAEARFTALRTDASPGPEIDVALGHTNLGQGEPVDALSNFRDALNKEPGNDAAIMGLNAAYDYPAIVEATVIAGHTTNGGGTGFRYAELGSWITPDVRIWGKLDRGLSVDNPVLSRANLDAETWSGGLAARLSDTFVVAGEVGYRDLPGGVSQDVYQGEASYLSTIGATKVGVQIAPHSDGYTDHLYYGAQKFVLSPAWSVEPTLYISRAGASNDREWRLIGYGEYRGDGLTLGVGAGGGNVDTDFAASSGSVEVAFAKATARVGGWHRLSLEISHESGPLNGITRILGGITFRLPRN